MSTDTSAAYETEIVIAAPPEQVFPYLVDAAKVRTWMGVDVDLPSVAGSPLRIDMNGRDVIVGEIVVVEAPARVVWTFGWAGSDVVPPGSSQVEFTLQPDARGTLVRLRHSGLPDEQRPFHAEGWTHYLGRLAVAAAGGDPGPDPWAA